MHDMEFPNVDYIVGKNIRVAREDMGWTQGELADEMGVTPSTVCRWEAGDVSIPARVLVPLAFVLGVALKELLP